MVTLEWSLERTDGVTLVGVVATAGRSCRVRIENRLDGPVWPPRRHGQPAEGWNDGTYTGCVPDTGRLTVGYATPAAASEPPVEVVSTEPVDGIPQSDGSAGGREPSAVPSIESSPAGVVRSLGDPVVPLDGVPVPADGGTETPSHGETNGEPNGAAGERGQSEQRETQRDSDGPLVSSAPGCNSGVAAESAATTGSLVPGAVRTWLDDVERRIDAGRESASDGGDRAAAALGAARRVDRQALERVRGRADTLLARAERSADRWTESANRSDDPAAGDAGDARTAGDGDTAWADGRDRRANRPAGPGGR